MFYAYTEEYKHNDCYKDKANLYNMYKIKLHKTSKCLWPVYTDMFVVRWMSFFQRFHKSLSENVLCKMTIDLLYFRGIYDVNLWEKNLAEVQLINAEQMSLYNSMILRKKETPTQVFSCGICETFKNSGGYFWKHLTYYYIIKNYLGHKLAIFNAVLLLYCIYC